MVKQIASFPIRSVTQGIKKTIKNYVIISGVFFYACALSSYCLCMEETVGQVAIRGTQNCRLGQNTSGSIVSRALCVGSATEGDILDEQCIHSLEDQCINTVFQEIEHASFEQLVDFMVQKIIDLRQEAGLIIQPSESWPVLDNCLPDLRELITIVLLSFLHDQDSLKEYRHPQDYNILIQPVCFYTLQYMRLMHSIRLVDGSHCYPMTQSNIRRLFITCFHVAAGTIVDEGFCIMPHNQRDTSTMSMRDRQAMQKSLCIEHPQMYRLLKCITQGEFELIEIFFHRHLPLRIPLPDVVKMAQEFKLHLIN